MENNTVQELNVDASLDYDVGDVRRGYSVNMVKLLDKITNQLKSDCCVLYLTLDLTADDYQSSMSRSAFSLVEKLSWGTVRYRALFRCLNRMRLDLKTGLEHRIDSIHLTLNVHIDGGFIEPKNEIFVSEIPSVTEALRMFSNITDYINLYIKNDYVPLFSKSIEDYSNVNIELENCFHAIKLPPLAETQFKEYPTVEPDEVNVYSFLEYRNYCIYLRDYYYLTNKKSYSLSTKNSTIFVYTKDSLNVYNEDVKFAQDAYEIDRVQTAHALLDEFYNEEYLEDLPLVFYYTTENKMTIEIDSFPKYYMAANLLDVMKDYKYTFIRLFERLFAGAVKPFDSKLVFIYRYLYGVLCYDGIEIDDIIVEHFKNPEYSSATYYLPNVSIDTLNDDYVDDKDFDGGVPFSVEIKCKNLVSTSPIPCAYLDKFSVLSEYYSFIFENCEIVVNVDSVIEEENYVALGWNTQLTLINSQLVINYNDNCAHHYPNVFDNSDFLLLQLDANTVKSLSSYEHPNYMSIYTYYPECIHTVIDANSSLYIRCAINNLTFRASPTEDIKTYLVFTLENFPKDLKYSQGYRYICIPQNICDKIHRCNFNNINITPTNTDSTSTNTILPFNNI